MEERLEYLIKDNHCEKAIDDFKVLSSVPYWLSQNAAMYHSISIQPQGLPRITMSNLGGESFENIKRFARLYEMVNSLFE